MTPSKTGFSVSIPTMSKLTATAAEIITATPTAAYTYFRRSARPVLAR
jgi:hypothetical protein